MLIIQCITLMNLLPLFIKLYLPILLPWKDNHIKFFDDVTMNHNGRLQNGIQPAACICKQLKTSAYFILVIICILIFAIFHFCLNTFRFKECKNSHSINA